MIPQDFFITLQPDPFGGDGMVPVQPRFDTRLVDQLRVAAPEGTTDLEAAVGLAQLVNDELLAFGTGGGESLDDAQMSAALVALRAVLRRLSVTFEPPYRNFSTFKSYWLRNDGYNSWQARRSMLEELFEPLHLRLARMEEQALEQLASPVSPRTATGWPAVDQEILELRHRFATCQSASDYRDIGNRCIAITEMLGDAVFDPARHIRSGETQPGRGETKKRFERYIEHQLEGSDSSAARAMARSVVVLAQQVKHRQTPDRREAGLAADAVIMLANILRRLADDRGQI